MTRKSMAEVVPQAREGLALAGSWEPGTILVRTSTDDFALGPGEGHHILFGRARCDVHVCVGEADEGVSRRHGSLEHRDGRWWVHNTGQRPIRIGKQLLFPGQEPLAFASGYTLMFIVTPNRQHPIEVFVFASDCELPPSRPTTPTAPPRIWALSDDEKLVLAVLAQRYLLRATHPQPLSWRAVADHLTRLQPEKSWTLKRVEYLVVGVRNRLSRGGVPALTRAEVGEPVGNTINHNLIEELLKTSTLTPNDLRLIATPVDYG